MTDEAVSWAEFEQADEALAGRVQARFESHRHAVLATLHSDGSPRLSGMEAPIRSGHLWLAMTPGSSKAEDLAADPRFSLHSAPDEEELPEGDARVDGRVRPATEAERTEFVAGHRFRLEDPTIMTLYVALLTRVVLVRVSDNALLIESWTPAHGHSTQRRT